MTDLCAVDMAESYPQKQSLTSRLVTVKVLTVDSCCYVGSGLVIHTACHLRNGTRDVSDRLALIAPEVEYHGSSSLSTHAMPVQQLRKPTLIRTAPEQ